MTLSFLSRYLDKRAFSFGYPNERIRRGG